MSYDGSDSRRRSTAKPRRKLSDRHGANESQLEDADDGDIDLNVRVKEREATVPEMTNRMGRIAIKGQSGITHDFKETIKRPLTGLFRRSGGSKSTKNDAKDDTEKTSSSPASSSANVNHGNGVVVAGSAVKQPVKAIEKIPSDTERSYHSDSGKPQLTSSMNVQRVQPDLYLDSIMIKYPQLSKLDDIDISVLARYLCTEEESCDEDVSWTWDYLFASVSSEIREDWAFEDELDDGPYDSAITFDQHRSRPGVGAHGFSS